MRKFVLSIAAVLLAVSVAEADNNRVYSLEINYLLQKDGSALVTEVWDIDVAEGTEWYLVRNNLRDMEVKDFMVHDERPGMYMVDEPWEIDRKLEEKAGRCGINETDEGLELCWGLGSYGHHTYTVMYTLTNAVQSLHDYDMFHIQTVNRKLSTVPEKVRTTVEIKDCQLDTTNTLLWGFGYEGSARLVSGKALFASSEPFVQESSMICLLRFNKGIFDSSSILEKDFGEHLDAALDNSGYIEDDLNPWGVIGGILGAILLISLGITALVRSSRRQVLGLNYDEVEESREIPFEGDLFVANQIMDELMESRRGSSVAAAMIIRMIYNNILRVKKIDNGKIEISFNPEFNGGLEGPALVLFNMMKEASGDDGILQEKEFQKWSGKHEKRVVRWERAIDNSAKKFIKDKGYKLDGRYNEEFQREARKLLGLKKYLRKFSQIKSAEVDDVDRLKEYLVYAALFEIADDLIDQINAVNPAFFDESGFFDYNTWRLVTNHNTNLSRSITNTVALSGSGTGGGSSFGGGAGFSGGGCGGGAR